MLHIVGWVLLGILLFLFILLLLPVHTRARYDGALQVWAGLGPVSLRVYPLKSSKKKPEKKEKTQAAEKKSRKKATANKKRGSLSFEMICDYIRLGAEALGKMKRRLVLKNLTCHLKIASNDAAKTAITYGQVTGAVSALYPVLERNLRIKKTDISVDADFEGSKWDILADVTLAVCPLRMLIAACILGLHFLKIRRKHKHLAKAKVKKGGTKNEQHP